MPDRREALTNISSSLQQAAVGLEALTQPGDEHLPIDMRHLLNAIDRVDVAPSITPGTYIRLRREACDMTIENVAMEIESDPQVSVSRRIEGLTMIEADVEEISPSTAMVLHEVIGIDLRILAYWMAIAEGATPSPVGIPRAPNAELPA
jgi:hypothetical protein